MTSGSGEPVPVPPAPVRYRAAGPADADALARHVAIGTGTYRAFAPAGWAPPPDMTDLNQMRQMLEDPACWALIAETESGSVGHVTWRPARERSAAEGRPQDPRPLVPGLAHLAHLFVVPAWWGSGVAEALHARALASMRERGFDQARLFTPALQRRARRFYERHGWTAVAGAFNPVLHLEMAEYRRPLP